MASRGEFLWAGFANNESLYRRMSTKYKSSKLFWRILEDNKQNKRENWSKETLRICACKSPIAELCATCSWNGDDFLPVFAFASLFAVKFLLILMNSISKFMSACLHPRRPRGGQSGREKRRNKSFQAQAEKPWVLALTGPFLNGQENAGSWLGTKNALYYCAQLANSISWVLFVSSYTTALTRSRLVWLMHAAKKCTQSGIFQFESNRYISKYW